MTGSAHIASVFPGFALWLLGSGVALAACAGPTALTASLHAKPTAQAYANLGNWFADQKQFDCAAQSFASAAGLQPDSVPFNYLWGLSLSSAGHENESLSPLRRAIELDPTDIRLHLALGAALDKLRQITDAEQEWRKALAIDAESSPALDGLSQDLVDQKDFTGVVALFVKPTISQERSAIQSLNLGIAYAGTARLADAARVLREALNTTPDSLPIADELGVALMLLGREDEAYAVFELALQKHPNDQQTQLLYLRTLVSSHSDKAPEFARKLLNQYADQWEVLYLNAVLETAAGKSQQAKEHLERSVALNPQSVESQRALGNILTQLKDLPGAKVHLEKAIAAGDPSPEVQYMLAKVLQALGDDVHANERLSMYQHLKNAQMGKTQAAGKAEAGDQAMAAGQEAQAATLYREALASAPDQPLLLYKLAKTLDKLKDIDGERAELQRAIELDPNLAEAQNQMGFLAIRDGDFANAETYFRAAVRSSPSYVIGWINLAATLANETKWQDAKQALDRALQIDPDNAAARQLSQALAEAHPGT